MQHSNPIGKLVTGMKMHNAAAGCDHQRPSQFHRRGALPQAVAQGGDDFLRGVAQEGIGECCQAMPLLVLSGLEQSRNGGTGVVHQGHQIQRMAPGVTFLTALCHGQVPEHAGQDGAGVFPANMLQELKAFVDEIQRMAHIEIEVIGRSRQQHIGHIRRRGAQRQRCEHTALRPVAVAHLDPTPQPTF